MEEQCSTLSWAWYCHEEGMEELKHCLLYTTLELETTMACAHEELARKGDELVHLKGLLAKAIQERDAAQLNCQRLGLDNLFLQEQIQQFHRCHRRIQRPDQQEQQQQEEEEVIKDPTFGLECPSVENVSGPPGTIRVPTSPRAPAPEPVPTGESPAEKPLPENGKFLQAVIDAGPLLQTLLLAGPLPRWQHPPPQLDSTEIPQVTMTATPRSCVSPGGFGKKRGPPECCGGTDSPAHTKNQKVVHQPALTNTR